MAMSPVRACMAAAFSFLPLIAQASHASPTPRPTLTKSKVIQVAARTVTLQDPTGAQQVVELESVKGIRVGAAAGWCEEDCGVVAIGGRQWRVLRVRAAGAAAVSAP